MITVKYPGKLYLMGEYSILNPGHHALVLSVNRYLTVTIKENDKLYIESDHGIIDDEFNGKMPHVEKAITSAFEYLNLKGIKINDKFNMIIESELDDGVNKKYGFGSSGVVIVAVIDAVLKFHNKNIDSLTLYKLAVYTQVVLDELSSGGELASSIYGGLILYRRPIFSPKSIRDVEKEWPGLCIKRIPYSFQVAVGYTNQGFNSRKFLEKVQHKKKLDINTYQRLMKRADAIVLDFSNNLWDKNKISEYRNWMLEFSSWADIEIETTQLTHLIESALSLGYQAKVSGAGGGDCGIVIDDNIDFDRLALKWKERDIELLKGVVS